MKQDKETRNKLLLSARKEFMEKGYMNASLRNICKNAGVTTGALYFFFKDKADLFEALTKDTVEAIFQIMQSHYAAELNAVSVGMQGEDEYGADDSDYEDSKVMIHQMYLRREDILIVLTKSQGSSMENIKDIFIDASEEHYRVLAGKMQQVYPNKVIEDNFIHWMAHMQVDAFSYMITHIENEEEALNFISQTVSYMGAGWHGLLFGK